jgi:hypothetical protein
MITFIVCRRAQNISMHTYLDWLCNRCAKFWGFVVHGMGISNCEIKLWSFQNGQGFGVFLSFEQTFCSNVLALREALKRFNHCDYYVKWVAYNLAKPCAIFDS